MLVALATELALLSTWLGYIRRFRPVEKILGLIDQRADSKTFSQGSSGQTSAIKYDRTVLLVTDHLLPGPLCR